jgi:hypothetical protein
MYVGQTTKESWFDRHRYAEISAKCNSRTGKDLRPFEKAILKYGYAAFDFRDLMTNVPDDQLDALEKFFISYFRCDDKRFGYNIESGGNRLKKILPHVRAKISEANKRMRTWEKRGYGRIVASISEIAELDPSTTVNGLQPLVCGTSRSHQGWVCLTPRRRLKVSRRVVHVWEHPDHGRVISTGKGLSRRFPEQNLSRQELAYVANPTYEWTKSHRGWRWVRRATDREETECCLSGDL